MELHDVIARIMELVNQEPRYYAELVRHFISEEGYSWSYWAEKVGQALWILLEEGKIEKVNLKAGELVTSTIWKPYSLYYPTKEPPIGWDKYNKKASKKLLRIGRLSQIGMENAEIYERLVYEAVKALYPDAEKTDFKSPLPDIYVPSLNLIVEATTRFEFPITRNYLLWKYYHLARPFNPDKYYDEAYLNEEKPLKMLVVGPIISKEAWDFVKKGQFDPESGIPQAFQTRVPAIKVIQFPKTSKAHAGWPVFRKYRYYVSWLEEYHRKVYLMPPYKEAKRRLINALRNAIENWKEQEQVLISSKG